MGVQKVVRSNRTAPTIFLLPEESRFALVNWTSDLPLSIQSKTHRVPVPEPCRWRLRRSRFWPAPLMSLGIGNDGPGRKMGVQACPASANLYLNILGEAGEARNGWQRLLARCAPSKQQTPNSSLAYV